jgi:putative ABC transport system permease protein
MTFGTLVVRSARYFWRTNLAVALGVATAVSVLSGALLVGDSVRGSLRDLAVGRLGRVDSAIVSPQYFDEGVAARLGPAGAAPLITATAIVTHERSGRRAANVAVYGVDERFWSFHGLDTAAGVYASDALARELEARPDDVLLARLQRPSEIPLESLFGRRDDPGRSLRLTLTAPLSRQRLGEFALAPQQSEVRALFVPLRRVQRDLGVAAKVNTVLLGDAVMAGRALASLTLDDLGVGVAVVGDGRWIAVSADSGVMSDRLQEAASRAIEDTGIRPVPVFTYLANSIRSSGHTIPYSLVTAIDLSLVTTQPASGDTIVVNEWAARDLGATPGAPVELEYFVWDPAAGLRTDTRRFTLGAIVPIAGLAADRQLAPDYPGITGSESVADWDPPFPLDLSRVRPADEAYWKAYRTTPKAFIGYASGRGMWSTRYGGATSVRAAVPPGADAQQLRDRVAAGLRRRFQPADAAVALLPARQMAERASVGATDFGEYFTYFSFFLVAAAVLLAVLFFRLGVEQRLNQIGVLRSAGFPIDRIRRLLLLEAIVLAAIGSAIGVPGAVLYAGAIIYGLRTWWIGAVGTTLLELHVSPLSLAIGAAAGVVVSALCVPLTLRAVARLSPRALLTAQSIDGGSASRGAAGRRRAIAIVLAAIGLALAAAGFIKTDLQGGAFFGAGAMLLAASMFFLAARLGSGGGAPIGGHGTWAVARLGFRSAAFRPARSVLSASLIASAAFVIVAVDAFRRGGGEITGDAKSGTGGYALLAQSQLPIVENPNDAKARESLGLSTAGDVAFARFRVRPGEDASCLNLYRPTNPTIVGADAAFIDSGRFTFASAMAGDDRERANPWLLLRKPLADGAVPVIADATSLQYVLHLGVGDEMTIDTGAQAPLRLRFVAALSDSVLQGEIVMAEERFVQLFPAIQGYRMFLVSAPAASRGAAASLAQTLERDLDPFGFDAVIAADRLAAFHRVENTYLSTFQALGGLGLLLGTVGLATILFRNVLERRRELALLRAVGYDARRVSVMIVAEAAFVLAAGLLAGALCAAVAVMPAWLSRSSTLPGLGLVLLLAAVAVAGLLSSIVATRAAIRGNMLAALRAE